MGVVPPLTRPVWDSCAPRRFAPDEVPDEDVQTILALATQAPSGFNLQPWRFVVVRNREQRERLMRAMPSQPHSTDAPVVVVAFGRREAWGEYVSEILGVDLGDGVALAAAHQRHQRALDFVRHQAIAVWLNRHVMVAVTYMMVTAQALGWDAALMECFDATTVSRVLDLPDDAEVVAIMAMGRLCDPDPELPGRLPMEKLMSAERFGAPLGQLAGGVA